MESKKFSSSFGEIFFKLVVGILLSSDTNLFPSPFGEISFKLKKDTLILPEEKKVSVPFRGDIL